MIIDRQKRIVVGRKQKDFAREEGVGAGGVDKGRIDAANSLAETGYAS